MSSLRLDTIAILAIVTGASLIGGTEGAGAQIIATPNIEQLCRSAPAITYRKTVVYVDLASVRSAKPEWGLTILNRLELGPRETLAVIAVNPNTFEVREVFDTCLPSLSNAEIDEARRSRGVWEKLISLDPVDQQRENLNTFDARLRNALDRIIGEAAKYQEGKRRNVLGAIALDKNRYADRNAFYRVIIYTDGNIKDPRLDGTGGLSSQVTSSLAELYPASLSGAEVAIFGIGGNASDMSMEKREQSFSSFFLRSWAHVKSFSPSLPQQDNFLYPPAMRMEGTFDGGGAQGAVKLAIFAAKQGNAADGWLAFNVGRDMLYIPFQGEYRCGGEDCRLVATCTESVPPQAPNPYFRRGDKIVLNGKPERAFAGVLQAEAREVFKDQNQSVKYELKFSMQ
jgi:hypothetical protein